MIINVTTKRPVKVLGRAGAACTSGICGALAG